MTGYRLNRLLVSEVNASQNGKYMGLHYLPRPTLSTLGTNGLIISTTVFPGLK